jgi:predicted AlkP superfamily phosphohydrolase/phosphomutase
MKVVLFGVDGLTFRILDPMMERGLLPNFQRMRDSGVQSILKSTIPPMTPPAWMSISTGLSPAKHGVYDFWEYEQTEKGPRAHVVTHRKGGKAIWNILSECGKQVVVANVPMTYPPEPVNGIMLSGLMAPDIKANVTYPASFKEDLLQAVPRYQIDLNPAVSSGQIGDLFAETLKMTHERIAMFRLLLSKPRDFWFITFVGADRIQHEYWDEIMAFHPQAIEYYQMVDEALGMALDILDAEDMIMVVSDHGFQGAHREFYIHEYLHRQCLLKMRNSISRRRAEFLGLVRDSVRTLRLQQFAGLLRSQLYRNGVVSTIKEQKPTAMPDLDWANTHAWLPSSSGATAGYADIFFDDSMPEENICELMAALQEIRDPETGQPLVVAMHREDVFGIGPFAPHERHLVLLSGENTILPTILGRRFLWETLDFSFGIHHPDGVLYLYGAGVKRGVTIAPTHVYDVVPTILSFMGIPLPDDLDGKIMEEAFERTLSTGTRHEDDSLVKRKLKKLTSLTT